MVSTATRLKLFAVDIGDHVRVAILLAEHSEPEAALLHALQAIDGTGKKLRPTADTRERIVETIDQYAWVIEPMIGMGIDITGSTIPFVQLNHRPSRFSEVLYELFRTYLAHGDPLPAGTGISLSVGQFDRSWQAGPGNSITVPDTVTWGLIAAAVLCQANSGQHVGNESLFEYHSPDASDDRTFRIDDWWGREDEVRSYFEGVRDRSVRVKMLPAPQPGSPTKPTADPSR